MFNKILVPLDGSKVAESVFPYLKEITNACSIKEVILFSVCEPISINSDYPASMPDDWETHVKNLTDSENVQCGLYLKDAKNRLEDHGIDNLKIETRLGDVVHEIVEYVSHNSIDLIIIASHGRSGPSRWTHGNVAEKVFRSTCVPILMVRGSGCVTGI
jgi:nucleotide-binding universal stress UspA family protein